MIESTAEDLARHLPEYLGRVERGETVRIRSGGRLIARVVPDCEFISGARAAELFRNHEPDPESADAVAAELGKLAQDSEHGLDH